MLPRLRRFARALARDVDAADDLVQAALERALRRRETWREGTRLDSWMFTLMRNLFIDETRSRGRRARVLGGDVALSVADPSVPDLEARRLGGAVEAAVRRLPDDQREVVALVLIEGLSYREAADVLALPMGTVTSRLARARAALMNDLEGM